MREQEVEAIRGAEVIWCVSEEERAFVESVAPATPTCFVRYGAQPERASPGFASRQGIVFLGSFIAGVDSPNEDAVMHLLGDLMPRLWNDTPELRVRVVGADPPPRLMALSGGRVEVVGYQRDPRPFLAEARVMVAPIRIGAGVKLKLIESMASGLPFVTTPSGAEGLGLGRLADDVVAADEEGITRLTRRLYDDREHWEAVRLELASVYARLFTPARFRDDLIAAMSWAGVAPP
jgi:glycosyltransferase involved in cell wall biosynthesis